MKNSEIHKGLDKEEIREFLSVALVKNFSGYKQPDYKRNYDAENPVLTSLNFAKQDLDCAKQKYYQAQSLFAVTRLIEICDWKEFDVSDETMQDVELEHWRSFIGTQEEYDTLIKKIESEKS